MKRLCISLSLDEQFGEFAGKTAEIYGMHAAQYRQQGDQAQRYIKPFHGFASFLGTQ